MVLPLKSQESCWGADVKSAKEEGINCGGGIALVQAAKTLQNVTVENEDQQFGVDIVGATAQEPLRQMAINCGLSPDLILNLIEGHDINYGYDFRKDKIVNMLEEGIIGAHRTEIGQGWPILEQYGKKLSGENGFGC